MGTPDSRHRCLVSTLSKATTAGSRVLADSGRLHLLLRGPVQIEGEGEDAERLPREHYLYLGDTARQPYGQKPIGEVRELARPILLLAVGLVLVSYPLHPPGKPDRLRVEQLEPAHPRFIDDVGDRAEET